MFKNPKVVGVLVLIAFLAVSKQIILPLLPSFSRRDVATKVASVVQQAKSVKVVPLAPPINMSELGWFKGRGRDPFTLSAHASSVGSGIEEHRLSGVIINDNQQLAVINGEVVGLGEKFEDYVIITIGANFVVMKGPDGLKKLKF